MQLSPPFMSSSFLWPFILSHLLPEDNHSATVPQNLRVHQGHPGTRLVGQLPSWPGNLHPAGNRKSAPQMDGTKTVSLSPYEGQRQGREEGCVPPILLSDQASRFFPRDQKTLREQR